MALNWPQTQCDAKIEFVKDGIKFHMIWYAMDDNAYVYDICITAVHSLVSQWLIDSNGRDQCAGNPFNMYTQTHTAAQPDPNQQKKYCCVWFSQVLSMQLNKWCGNDWILNFRLLMYKQRKNCCLNQTRFSSSIHVSCDLVGKKGGRNFCFLSCK